VVESSDLCRVSAEVRVTYLGQTIYSDGSGPARIDCKGAEGCREHQGEKSTDQTESIRGDKPPFGYPLDLGECVGDYALSIVSSKRLADEKRATQGQAEDTISTHSFVIALSGLSDRERETAAATEYQARLAMRMKEIEELKENQETPENSREM
jgi:hypothetical protein